MALFGKVKIQKDRKNLQDLLKYIVEQTASAAGQGVVPASYAREIVTLEPTFIEVLGEPNVVGNVFAKALPDGVKAITGAAPQSGDAKVATSAFTIEDGFTAPPAARGVARSETYPFSQMQKGQSFFVAATEEKPNPAKSLTSTLTSVNRRYSGVFPAKQGKNPHPQAGQPNGKEKRKYVVRPRKAGDLADATQPNGKRETSNGARVFRIE